MTIYAKASPVGIDKAIYKVQQKLNAIGWSNISVYGKLYLTIRNDKVIAEAYKSSGEYAEVFLDDKQSAVFGFIVSDNREGLSFVKAELKLICSINLDKVFDSTERKDEEAILTVLRSITPTLLSDSEGAIITDFENVFNGIDTERIKYRNMHPWLNFAVTFNVNYFNDMCDNNLVRTI